MGGFERIREELVSLFWARARSGCARRRISAPGSPADGV